VSQHDRQTQRRSSEIRVRYRTHSEYITRYSDNISHGGVFIRTLHFLPINTVLRLRMLLPGDEQEIPVIARVAHVIGTDMAAESGRAPGMGLEFLDLAPEGKVALHDTFLECVDRQDPEATRGQLKGTRILLVEDEGLVQRKIGSLFMRRGLRIALAGTGAEALTKCLKDPPDLILSDIRMPAMDGWTFLRLVKSRLSLSSVPFVFLASALSPHERQKAYELGADDFISKSTPPDEILARVERTLLKYQDNPEVMSARRVLHGDLDFVTLPTLLQMLMVEEKTGILRISHQQCQADVCLREGKPMSCALKPFDLTGRDALFELLDWDTGRFEFAADEYDGPDEIQMNVLQLLIEHSRIVDER
jgi:uncharacterized protein (TIGR02266 family)